MKSEPPESKRQENIEALIRLKAERLAPKQNPKKANTAEKPSPPQKRKRKSRQINEKQIQWLKINGIKPQDYTRADQYLAKQKREQTPMVFISYGQNYLCKVDGHWKYNLNLLIDDQLQSLSKVQLCGYYKQRDAEPVSAVMRGKGSESAIVRFFALRKGEWARSHKALAPFSAALQKLLAKGICK